MDVKVVATIDHPYTSPPIHLFDGHLRLARRFADTVAVLNWDVSQPGDRFYRYDTITDTGLLGKQSKLYHYELGIPYHQQSFDPGPWDLLPLCVDTAVHNLKNRINLSAAHATAIAGRAMYMINETKKVYRPDIAPWEYTWELLKWYYNKFQQPELSAFIERQYRNYYRSVIMTKWIPWCLTNLSGPLAFNAVAGAGVLTRNSFRVVEGPPLDEQCAGNCEYLAAEIAKGRFVPSLDVFLWSLAVARVNHYGNDFGLFGRLAIAARDPSIATLQLTGDEEDCRRFVKFDRDYGILVDISPDRVVTVSKRPSSPVKLTRTNSSSALFVALGSGAEELLRKYSHEEFTQATISLQGNVILC